jgi:hypothetical protein
MLIKAMRAERMKFRRSPVYLAFAVLTLLAAVLGTANYLGNLEVLKSGWYSLWTQHTLFACALFLPAELGVVCAWQWRLEHTDHCWNCLMTAPLPFWALYLAKLFWSALAAAGALAFTALCFVAGGMATGLRLGDLPPELPEWFLCGWFGCLAVCAWQQLLAMCIRSFAVPVAAALIGGVSGLFIMAKGWGLGWPWALLSMGMRANNPKLVIDLPVFFAACAVFTVLPTLAAIFLVHCSDIKSE